MHDIQKHILKKLMLSKKARYSELKLKSVEGNLFSYHLNILLKDGSIESKNGTYRLTAKSKLYIDKISAETFDTRLQPKIVTMVVLKQKDKYLLYKKNRMPFMDYIGFPYGKIHMEESVNEAAQRELLEKTGLHAVLKHRGIVCITIHEEAELVSQMLCHVFTGSKISGSLMNTHSGGEGFWAKIADYPKTRLIPGTLKVEKLLKENKNKFFFAEYFLNSSAEE